MQALKERSDGTFLLPDLEILDITYWERDEAIPATFELIQTRYFASNASSIKSLALRDVDPDPFYRYELEKYVPSLVIVPFIQ